MNSSAATPQEYLNSLPEPERTAMGKRRQEIAGNLPKGFGEQMENGMIAYVVPHSRYAPGYHAKPKSHSLS